MAPYKVILAYDGTEFRGFQIQGAERTVQGVVEEALRCIGWIGKSILAAGRTDAGVHATGQVIAFSLDWKHPAEVLKKALNANLPRDVSAREVSVVEDSFHPRYDAVWRVYNYHAYVDQTRDPVQERYAWRLEKTLDVDALCEAASYIVGEHDFAAFGSPMKPGGSTTRDVAEAFWVTEESRYKFVVKANAFLYHMVRRLVHSQVCVGTGRLDLETFRRGILVQEGQPRGIAPPNGLFLTGIQYPDR